MATIVIWGEKQVCCKTFYKSFFYVTNKVCSNKSLPCCHRIVFQAHSMSFTRKHQLFIFLLCSKPVFSTLVKIIYTFFKLPYYLAPIPFNNFLTLLKSISLTCNYIQLILLTCGFDGSLITHLSAIGDPVLTNSAREMALTSSSDSFC